MLRVTEVTKVIQYFFYTKPSASGISYQIRTQPDSLKTFIVHSNENTILGSSNKLTEHKKHCVKCGFKFYINHQHLQVKSVGETI